MGELFDLVVRGGEIVTASSRARADIGICGGRVVALADALEGGRTEIDATGLLVLPGGIDSHCHIDQKSSTGLMTADDFYTGGLSAACGGVTTFIPFAAQHRGDSLRAVVEEYHARASTRSFIDYGFHLIVSDPSERVLADELPVLIAQGYTSFKVYMTYESLRLSDEQMLQVLEVARAHGALVMVHAENHAAIGWQTARLLAAGHTAPRFHADARPPVAEREAVCRAIALAELVGVSILIVHVSSAAAMAEIVRARRRGVPVLAETCPQYLLLTAGDLDRPGFEGAKLVCSPPLRDAESQEALWRGLAAGDIDVWSSDHAPYRYDDPRGKKAFGEDAPFDRIPSGVPGLETLLPILFSEGVGKGRLDLHQFVSLTATRPATIYGFYPRKGTIAVGSDADLALWDPKREVTVSSLMLHDRMDYTPYEGRTLTGWPVVTISRGEVIWADGEVRGRPGRGMFLKRERFSVSGAA